MTPRLRRMALVALLVLLALGVGTLAVWRYSRSTSDPARVSAAPAATARSFTARRYPEPLVTLAELELDSQDTTEEEAESAIKGFRPRDDRPVWELKPPIDWAANPFKDRNWQFQLHALAMTHPLLARYAASNDSARYRQTLVFVLDWWNYHEHNKPAAYSWYDMATGKRAAILAFLLDRAFTGKEKLTDAEMSSLLAMAQAHVERLRNPKFIVTTNHGLFQIHGLASLCRVLSEVGPCSGADAYVQEHLSRLLDSQFDQYGVHREHSPQYHRLAMQAMQRFVQPGGTGVYKEVANRMQLAQAVFPWLAFPGGRLAALGDTEGEASGEPPPQQACGQAQARASCVEVGDFSSSGYVVVRSPWARPLKDSFMLIMTGMYNRSTHKHVDDLSFELMEHGELLLEDTGKYAYLKDSMNRFVHTARAHTTVGLEDREIFLTDTETYGSALQPPELDGTVHVLRGRVKRKKLFTQARRIDYAPGRFVLIDDALSSKSRQTYESYVHLARHLQPKEDGGAFVVPLAGGRSMRIESVSPDCKASEERGQKEPRIQGWVTKGYREMTPASALTFACAGKNRHITLLLSFDEKARVEGLARAAKAQAEPAN